VKLDAISQISSRQEIKAGFEARFPQMYQFSAPVLRNLTGISTPLYPSPQDSRYNTYKRYPKQYSGYLQDKMEYESIIMNVGLRYDYFLANAVYPASIFYPRGATLDAPAKQTLSPRIGVSYPITDKGIIHFSYGHFFQMPQLRRLYENPDFKFGTDVTSTTFGNANLNPEKTITYEFGLQQQIGDNLAFNITGFYKDVRDLFATQAIRISGDTTFNMYVNKDYGNIKGITFSLLKRRIASDLVSFSVDYTFQVGEGNDVSADAFFIDQSSGRESEKMVVYLGWDQPHTLNATLTVGKQMNWNVSMIGRVGSGLPYTPSTSNSEITPKPNSARRPAQSTVDLLAEKDFSMGELNFAVFLKIFNLFDALNEISVYDDTGRATYTLVSKQGDGPTVDAHLATTPGLHGTNDYYTNPTYYSSPREVRVGVTLDF
jgi:outer membrane receptor protein involved in Fe transport